MQVPGLLQHTEATCHPPDCGINTSGPDKARAAKATAAFFSSKQVGCRGMVMILDRNVTLPLP